MIMVYILWYNFLGQVHENKAAVVKTPDRYLVIQGMKHL